MPFKSSMQTIEDFAEETGVFGLNLIRERVPRIERLFWICLTIVLTVLTARDLVEVIKSYIEDETVMSVDLNSVEKIKFNPSPTVFLKVENTRIYPNNISNDSLLSILKTTFSQTRNPETLPNLLFETNLSLFEYISSNIEAPTMYPLSYAKPDRIDWNLYMVYNFYRENSISLVYLQKLTASMLCEKIGFAISLWWSENATNVCHPDLFTEVTGFKFVLKLSKMPVNFTSLHQRIKIEIGREYIQLVHRIVIDFEGQHSLYNRKSEGVIFVELGKNQHINESIGIKIQPVLTLKKVKRPSKECTHEPDINCRTRCAVQRFFECSSCWPLGAPFRFKPENDTELCPGDRFLTLSDTLDRCFPNKTSDEEYMAECDSICKAGYPPCEVKNFAFTESRWHSSRFFIELSIQSFSFPIFKERLALTWDTFLSNFGGSLGLYLGLSFASLVHIPVFFIRLLASVVSSKTADSSKTSSYQIKSFSSESQQGEVFILASRLAALEEIVAEISRKLSDHNIK